MDSVTISGSFAASSTYEADDVDGLETTGSFALHSPLHLRENVDATRTPGAPPSHGEVSLTDDADAYVSFLAAIADGLRQHVPPVLRSPSPLELEHWYISLASLQNERLAREHETAGGAAAARLVKDMSDNNVLAKQRIFFERQTALSLVADLQVDPLPALPSSPMPVATARRVLGPLCPTTAPESDDAAARGDARFSAALASLNGVSTTHDLQRLVHSFLCCSMRLWPGKSWRAPPPHVASAMSTAALSAATIDAAAPSLFDVVRKTSGIAGNHSTGAKLSVLREVLALRYAATPAMHSPSSVPGPSSRSSIRPSAQQRNVTARVEDARVRLDGVEAHDVSAAQAQHATASVEFVRSGAEYHRHDRNGDGIDEPRSRLSVGEPRSRLSVGGGSEASNIAIRSVRYGRPTGSSALPAMPSSSVFALPRTRSYFGGGGDSNSRRVGSEFPSTAAAAFARVAVGSSVTASNPRTVSGSGLVRPRSRTTSEATDESDGASNTQYAGRVDVHSRMSLSSFTHVSTVASPNDVVHAFLADLTVAATLFARGLLTRYPSLMTLTAPKAADAAATSGPSKGKAAAIVPVPQPRRAELIWTLGVTAPMPDACVAPGVTTLDASKLVLRVTTEALHGLLYDSTTRRLFRRAHMEADARWHAAASAVSELPPCAFGAGHAFCRGGGGCNAAASEAAAAAYAPAIACALMLFCVQRTPMGQLSALRACIRAVAYVAGVEGAAVNRRRKHVAAMADTDVANATRRMLDADVDGRGVHSDGKGTSPVSTLQLTPVVPRHRLHSPPGSALLNSADDAMAVPKGVGADDLLPRLCFVLARASPLIPHAPSTASFLEATVPEERAAGEDGYAVVSLRGAMTHVLSVAEGDA